MPEVRQERSSWRDEKLSERHRHWGWNCPALDIDFLMLEYDAGQPSALVEYKNEHAALQYPTHPSYQALIELGDRAGIPVIACRYADDFKWWRVIPLNQKAKEFVPERKEVTEKEFVTLLYKLRGRDIPQKIVDGLDIEI